MNFPRFRFLAGSALLAASLIAGAYAACAAEFVPCVYTNAAGNTLPYRLLQPDNYNPAQKYPLVLFLHGAGERGSDNKAQLKNSVGQFITTEHLKEFPCFVIAPQCPPNQQWVNMPWSGDRGTRPDEPSAPMQLALQVLDKVIADNSIDTNRLYVCGLSMGGYGTWDCVTRFPNRFAAGAPVCGGGDEKTVTAEVAKVPVWAFHSADDPVVKVGRTRHMVEAMRSAGGTPKYFEYFGLGHNSWDAAFSEPEFLPWMFAQRLGKSDTMVLKTKAPEVPEVARYPADDAFPGVGPLRSQHEWFRNLWCERRMGWWTSREKDKGAVVFLGDSITQGWGSLAKDFPQYKVANRGISGDLTRGILYRLKADVLDLDPAAIVLLIGTNDLDDGADPALIAENVGKILAACKAFNPKLPVIVCKVMPSDPSKNRPADKIQDINKRVDTIVAADPQFIRCDTWSIFADDKGNAKAEEFPDLLHPNAAGYVKFTQAVQPLLQKALGR